MKIVFMFPSGHEVLELELCDNSYIEKWYSKFVANYNMHAIGTNEIMCMEHNKDYKKNTDMLNQLHENLDKCKNYGLPINFILTPTLEECSQSFLNILHRFFTESKKLVVENCWKNWQEISLVLDDINEICHQLEYYYTTPVKEKYQQELRLFDEICILPNQVTLDDWLVLSVDERKYHSKQHYDVILGPQVLGKTLLKSYIDDDNPNHWDTSGHHWNASSLTILPYQRQREKIYESKNFRKWLKKHNYKNDALYDFPLGNVKNKKDIFRIQKLIRQYSVVETVYLA